MNPMQVNFGTSFLNFIKANIGEDKNLLILQDKFIESEYHVSLNDAMLELSANIIPFQKIKGGGRTYLAIADVKHKINRYLDSEVEGEFEATVLELPH